MAAPPPWLESLLTTEFFSTCRVHGHFPRRECNLYCLECRNGGAFCPYCRSARHKDHRIVQIRRMSYHNVVRLSEIQEVVDVAGVQTYVINGARVVFLNKRPRLRIRTAPSGNKSGAGNNSRICQICSRSLLDPLGFCSLGCMVAGMKRSNGDDSSGNLDGKENERPAMELEEIKGSITSMPFSKVEEEMHEASKQIACYRPPCSNLHRRRKGIPHRAPF